MSELLRTWGELCERAGIDPDGAPADAPVEKLIGGSNVVRSTSLGSAPPCQSARTCYGPGACGAC